MTTSPSATTPSATPAAPRADPPPRHTQLQQVATASGSGVVKGSARADGRAFSLEAAGRVEPGQGQRRNRPPLGSPHPQAGQGPPRHLVTVAPKTTRHPSTPEDLPPDLRSAVASFVA
jgi:hypothetical protein